MKYEEKQRDGRGEKLVERNGKEQRGEPRQRRAQAEEKDGHEMDT